jgi:phenylalanyl-tRNA synthetase beta chain
VPEAIRESRVRDLILAEGGALIESLEVFDLYRGEQIPKGTKSLAYGILYRSESRTLVEDEVDKLQQRMEERLSKELGARIRAK